MKMALLAALIVFATVLCAQDGNQLVDAQPTFQHAPIIETQVLIG